MSGELRRSRAKISGALRNNDSSYLTRTPDHGYVVAQSARPAEQVLIHVLTGRRITAKYPKKPAGGLADNRPLIVVGVIENPVFPEEKRTKKRNSELGASGPRHDSGAPLGHTPGPFWCPLVAGIDHFDKPVRPGRIIGGHALAAAFKAVLDSAKLIPPPKIPIEIDRFRRLRHGGIADPVRRRAHYGRAHYGRKSHARGAGQQEHRNDPCRS